MSSIKQETIRKIYTQYFEIIDSFFGSIKHYLGDEEDSHIDLGIQISSYPLISDLVIDATEEFDKEIQEFWQKNAKTVFNYIKEQDTLKCLYSGDISPRVLENFVKKSCLYVDSVIISDPAYNITSMQKDIITDSKYYLNKLIRHIFNIWKLKDLILASTKDNIIFILPINLHLLTENDRNTLLINAENKFIQYFCNLTNEQQLKNRDEAMELLNQKSIEEIFNLVKNSPILPFFFREQSKFFSFFSDFNSTAQYSAMEEKSLGWNFALYIYSQFIRVQEHKFFCDKLNAEPIYDFELPWFFFEYECGYVGMDSSIATTLQKEQFQWIANIPLKALKILREENHLDYMRMILRKGVTDLKVKNDLELIKVSAQIEDNFKEAFNRQNTELSSLKNRVSQITKKEMPITIGASLIGALPVVGVPISFLSVGRDVKKLLDEKGSLTANIENKENSFMNLLIQSYERK